MSQSSKDNWQDVEQFEQFGIVTYNFNANRCDKENSRKFFESILSLSIGESVIVLRKYRIDWYYGYAARNRYLKGIFPQSYVNLCQINDELHSGYNDGVYEPKRPQFVQEITTVLLDWGSQLRNLYLIDNKKLEQFAVNFYELADHRSELLSGRIPADRLKETKSLITYKIDVGNKILGLDIVVRDENGCQLDVETSSTLQLYYQHKSVAERIKKNWEPKKENENVQKSIIAYIFRICAKFCL